MNANTSSSTVSPFFLIGITAWIECEARGKVWQKQAVTKAQGDLFQWAEARTEVGARKKANPQPSKPTPTPRRKPTRTRTPE